MRAPSLFLLAAVAQALPACSVKHTLDQQTMDEISRACGLVGSRIIRVDGRNLIDVHMRDDSDEKYRCIRSEIERRNLATWPNYGDLGDDRPPRTPDQQRCVDELFLDQGLQAANNMQSVCGAE